MNAYLDSLKANTLKNMETVFKKLPGEKYMLVDPDLLRALDKTISMKFLSAFNVRKVFKIQQLPPESSYERLIYIVPPTNQSVKMILEHAEVDRKADIKRLKLIAFVPKQTEVVRCMLESQGVLGDNLQISDLSFGWLPIDSDLISLNLPEVYTEYFLHGDTSWPYHFGQMLGQLLEAVIPPSQSITDVILHALGSAAQVSAAGLRSTLARIKTNRATSSHFDSVASPETMKTKGGHRSSPSSVTSHYPMFILFSRNLDYITPCLVPMTFEALIHEVVGIDNGVVILPSVPKDDLVQPKFTLTSSVFSSYKEVRDSHISTVHTWLQARRSQLEDSRTGLDFSLTALNSLIPSSSSSSPSMSTLSSTGGISSTASLTDIGTQLKPILATRRELTTLLLCLEEVMNKMTNEERVEDLISAQTTILQSGSGGALAMPSGREIIPLSSLTRGSSAEAMPHEAATGSCADDANCQPVRLALEWLSTNSGDRLIDAVRLLCLLSVTHDGLGEPLYNQVLLHIQHSVGFSVLPLLLALRRLKLLSVRKDFASVSTKSRTSASDSAPVSLSLTVSASAERFVASATERLIKRRKSVYNYLHRQFHLSLVGQVSQPLDKPAISPTYVFGGQHVPIVVRLAESLWATGLAGANDSEGPPSFGGPLGGPELLSKSQLIRGFTLLHTDELSAKNLGRICLEVGGNPPKATLSHGQLMVVVFVGGCSYAEVAALRFAAQRRCWRLLIVTSQLLSTKTLIQQVGKAVM